LRDIAVKATERNTFHPARSLMMSEPAFSPVVNTIEFAEFTAKLRDSSSTDSLSRFHLLPESDPKFRVHVLQTMRDHLARGWKDSPVDFINTNRMSIMKDPELLHLTQDIIEAFEKEKFHDNRQLSFFIMNLMENPEWARSDQAFDVVMKTLKRSLANKSPENFRGFLERVLFRQQKPIAFVQHPRFHELLALVAGGLPDDSFKETEVNRYLAAVSKMDPEIARICEGSRDCRISLLRKFGYPTPRLTKACVVGFVKGLFGK
jgi:hypothetical protein